MTAGTEQVELTEAPVVKYLEPEKEPEKPVETKHVERLKHPLEHTWTMWLYRDTGKDWIDDLIELTTFDTVEDFWCLYHHMKLPSEVGDAQYSVFKDGMRPTWEDAGNRRGGRLLITLEKKNGCEVDRLWTDMALLTIGENFGDCNDIVCGAVVNAKARNYKSKLAIWVSDCKNLTAVKKIGFKLKQVLGLPFRITFHAHNSTSTILSI